tara:strand:+ start:19032 stop:19379 length:348 start_codon:yes stop_codon:yes gene_type:complete
LQYRLVNIWLCVCVGFVGLYGLYYLQLTADDSYTCFKKKLPFCAQAFVVQLLCVICVNNFLKSVKNGTVFFALFTILSAALGVIKAKLAKFVSSPEHDFNKPANMPCSSKMMVSI